MQKRNDFWKPSRLPSHWQRSDVSKGYGGYCRTLGNDAKLRAQGRTDEAGRWGHTYEPTAVGVPAIDKELMGPVERGRNRRGRSPGWDYDTGTWRDRSPVQFVPKMVFGGDAHRVRRNKRLLNGQVPSRQCCVKQAWGLWADTHFRDVAPEASARWHVDPLNQCMDHYLLPDGEVVRSETPVEGNVACFTGEQWAYLKVAGSPTLGADNRAATLDGDSSPCHVKYK